MCSEAGKGNWVISNGYVVGLRVKGRVKRKLMQVKIKMISERDRKKAKTKQGKV